MPTLRPRRLPSPPLSPPPFLDSDWDPLNPPPPPPPLPFLFFSDDDISLTDHPSFLFFSDEDVSPTDHPSDPSVPSCPICREELCTPDAAVRHLPCAHAYHSHCISAWLQDKNTCPICRFRIPSSDLDLLLPPPPLPPLQNSAMPLIRVTELQARHISSAMLALPPPPPPPPPALLLSMQPPLPLPPPPPLSLICDRIASTSSLQPSPRVEIAMVPQSPTPMPTADSIQPPPTWLLSPPPEVSHVDVDTSSVTKSGSTRRFLKFLIRRSWWRSRCIGST